MKFHNILDDILSSKVKMSIVKALLHYPEKKFSGRELARIVNASPSRVWEILNFFQTYGLVNNIKIGNTIAWNLNTDSVFSRELSKIFHIDNRLLKDLKQRITYLFDRQIFTKKIVLFGSVVYGREAPDSDIDLFIVVKEEDDKDKVRDLIQKLNSDFLTLYGNTISEVIYSEEEFKLKRNTLLIRNIEAKGEVLLERKKWTK